MSGTHDELLALLESARKPTNVTVQQALLMIKDKLNAHNRRFEYLEDVVRKQRREIAKLKEMVE